MINVRNKEAGCVTPSLNRVPEDNDWLDQESPFPFPYGYSKDEFVEEVIRTRNLVKNKPEKIPMGEEGRVYMADRIVWELDEPSHVFLSEFFIHSFKHCCKSKPYY